MTTCHAFDAAPVPLEQAMPLAEMSVADQNTAVHVGFLGSPTVRIDGLDIEPSARQRTTFGMMCRTYEGSGGVPSEDLIRSAINAAETRSCSLGCHPGVSGE